MDRRLFIGGCVSTSLSVSLLPAAAKCQETMLTRVIPGTSEELPVIGYGGARIFGTENTDRAYELLDILISRGGRVVDAYGPMEQVFGQYMSDKGNTDLLFVASNVGTLDEASARNRLNQSLEELGKPSLDLMMLNRTNEPYPTLRHLAKLKESGAVRYIGFGFSGGGFIDTAVELINDGAIDVVMASYSMMEPAIADKLLPTAMDKGVAVIANRPFQNGDYFKKVAGKKLPKWTQEFDCNSWAQFSLKYIVGHPGVTTAISETGNPSHAIDNLSAGYGRLPDEKTRLKMRSYLLSL